MEDIEEEKVRQFLRKAKYERRLEIDPDISVKEALKRLSPIRGEKLTNVALLLFGKSPQRYFLQTEVRCARFKGTEAIKPFIDMKVFDGDLTGTNIEGWKGEVDKIQIKSGISGN